MKSLGYYIFFVFTWLITLLPFRALYIISDLVYFLIYHIFHYRREVVGKNLSNAFPEKSPDELDEIARRFYRHLSDLIIESLKALHMSPRQISRRFTIKDLSLIQRLYDEGKDIAALTSHYNNWEWLSSVQLITRHRAISIYKPLKNKYFDKFILDLRTKYGVFAMPMNRTLRELSRFRNQHILTLPAFLADQTPPADENTFWTTFLNQETDFYRGPEKIAVKFNMAVIFAHIKKIKRGYYVVDCSLITENAGEEEPEYIISRYAAMLEEVIRDKPEYWLWSHRRWKHKKPMNND
jgi:KDO2-lipid IV(A) lauroyltransferase